MTLENQLVLLMLLGFVLHRRHALGERLAEARARVRAEPLLPLMRHPTRRLPWE